MRVLKFGGTSLSNASQFIHIANILKNSFQKEQIAVVLSAPAKVTNYLVLAIEHTLKGIDGLKNIHKVEMIFNTLLNDIIKFQKKFNHIDLRFFLQQEFSQLKKLLHGVKLLKYCPDSVNAKIICLGEKLSIFIMKELLLAENYKITVIDPVKKLLAKGNYLTSMVDIKESKKRIQNMIISPNNLILMAGFIAGNKYGELVALGRNGSDYSAAVLAACLNASCCEIWTDVDGIYTCDPHQVPDAKLLRFLSYQEAMELSYFGAKILHPRTILPIAQFHIPCLIKNTLNSKASGTLISSVNNNDIANIVKGITHLTNMTMLNVSGPGMKGMIGMAARIFSAMSRAMCSIVLITQSSSEYSISFCIPNQELSTVCMVLHEEFELELKNGLLEPIDIIYNLAIISVVGDGMRTQLGLSSKLFLALSQAKINIIAIAQGSSERSISVVVKENVAEIGVKIAHRMLFNSNQLVEIFVIGVGGVGNALIEQIRRQRDWLKNKRIDLRVCGIFNSSAMLINLHGINLNSWKLNLMKTQERSNTKELINMIRDHRLFNPVIIDCTSSTEIADQYVDFLSNGCHVITPNKKANTGSMEYYLKLRSTSIQFNKKFLYDTNVGAGLPVIENLQNLLNAGDELLEFSGILSGSLSFIFGKLDDGMSLSEATLLAQKQGYTEPNPCDDLSGLDVARKLLIIAREVGYVLELEDIFVDSVIPSNIIKENNVQNDFLKGLALIDDDFLYRATKARNIGNVLRYIGNIQQGGKCRVQIESINGQNPLFKVKGGENALAFFTRYYQPLPLVMRGYGAGNNVTAAGIFADLLRVLS